MYMREIKTNRFATGAIVGLALAAILIGCGGSGSGGSGSMGSVQAAMDWTGTRAADQAQSVTFTLTNVGTQEAVKQIMNKAASQAQQSAVFTGLPAGNFILTAKGFDQTNGMGNEVSEVATSLTVTPGSMKTVAMAMVAQIKDLVIPTPPTPPTAGSTMQMTGFAEDSMGRLVMLPPNTLQWSVAQNGFGATIQPNGVLVTSAAGTITVTLAASGTSQRATVTLNISNPSSTGGSAGTTAGTTGTTTATTTGTSTTTSGTTTTGTTTATTTGTSTSGTTGTTTSTTTGTTGTSGTTTTTGTTGATTGVTTGTSTGTTTAVTTGGVTAGSTGG